MAGHYYRLYIRTTFLIRAPPSQYGNRSREVGDPTLDSTFGPPARVPLGRGFRQRRAAYQRLDDAREALPVHHWQCRHSAGKSCILSLVCILYREAAARVHGRYTTVT